MFFLHLAALIQLASLTASPSPCFQAVTAQMDLQLFQSQVMALMPTQASEAHGLDLIDSPTKAA